MNEAESALNSEYPVSLERKVILAQEKTDQQKIQDRKYQLNRKALQEELLVLRMKCDEFEKNGGMRDHDKNLWSKIRIKNRIFES